ncbi:MAG: hypothetical protein IJI43_03470 [Bacilli bacterium]|nr:hypothetical protein [Bacilli bacterium]
MKKYLLIALISFLLIPTQVFAVDKASKVISGLSDSNLVNDGTSDNNKRYVGMNPNNYVLFNGETPGVATEKYRIYLTNTLLPKDDEHDGYPTEADCTSDVNSYVGHVMDYGASYTCTLNTDTSEYELRTTGYLSNDYINTNGGYDDTSLSSCQGFISNVGMPDTAACTENHIMFKGWRIVGVFNVNGVKRVKLVRNESIGLYSWDSTPSDVNAGFGRNEWSESGIQRLLNPGYTGIANNSLYWDSGSGFCYTNAGASANPCDFADSGLKDSGKAFIDDALWHTSFVNTAASSVALYEAEKSGNTTITPPTDSPATDGITRHATWTGKVGLLSASDLALASLNCNASLIDSGVSGCANNWLFDTTKPTLTMTSSVKGVSKVLINDTTNIFTTTDASNPGEVYPAVFLSDDTYIISGTGSVNDPFILGKGKSVDVDLILGNNYSLSNYITDISDFSSLNWEIDDPTVVGVSGASLTPKKVGVTKMSTFTNGLYYVVNVNVRKVQPRIDPDASSNTSGSSSSSVSSGTSNSSNELVNPKTSYLNKINNVKNNLRGDIITFVIFLVVSAFSLFAAFKYKKN